MQTRWPCSGNAIRLSRTQVGQVATSTDGRRTGAIWRALIGMVRLLDNYAAAPWCQVTPDIQVLVPTWERVSSAVLVGVQAKVDF